MWLTTFLLVASGCHKENPAQSVAPSDTKPFDVAEAMMMVYGNYDVKAQTSVASLPKEKSSFPAAAGEEQNTIRMLFNTFQGDAGARRFLLATYAVPTSGQGFDCHACAPTIGMTTFVQNGQKWTIDSLSRAITPSGEWGKPPTDIQLVQIGPSRQALQIIDVSKQNGETTRLLQLLIPWNGTVNLGLERIIADGDLGSCDTKAGFLCYANHRTLTYGRSENPDYYNLEFELSGTDLPISDESRSMRVRKVRGREIFSSRMGNMSESFDRVT